MFCFHIHSLYNLSAANFLYRLVKTVILFCNVSPPTPPPSYEINLSAPYRFGSGVDARKPEGF